MPLFSIIGYAKHRGVTKQAVSKAVRDGRISTTTDEFGVRKIDSDVADQEWTVRTNDSRRPLSERVENARRNASLAPAPGTEGSGKSKRVVGGSAEKTVQEYADARAEREGYQARLTRIELGKKSGELVSAKAVEAESFRMGRIIRDNLFNIPERISHQLAAETDPNKIHEILRSEIHEVLELLANSVSEPEPQTEPNETDDEPKVVVAGETSEQGLSHASP